MTEKGENDGPGPDYAVIRHYHVDRLFVKVSTGVRFDQSWGALGEVLSSAPTPTGASASSSKKGMDREKKNAATAAVMVSKIFTIQILPLEPG